MKAVQTRAFIAVSVIVLSIPLTALSVSRDWIGVAPEAVKRLSAQISSLEEQLSRSTSVTDQTKLKRRLVGLMAGLADQYAYAGQQSERILSLARAESLRNELEALGLQNERLYDDYYDHGDFLANFGFGSPLRSTYYLRRAEPDYPGALTCFKKASESNDPKLRERAEAEIKKITTPVVALGNVLYTDDEIILALAARNLDEVAVKLTCTSQAVKVTREWTANFSSIDDHRVQTHFYRIGLSSCRQVDVVAESKVGAVNTLSLAESDKKVWGVRQDKEIDKQSKTEVADVSRLAMMSERFSVKGNHAMNQSCSVCHIPHAAGE